MRTEERWSLTDEVGTITKRREKVVSEGGRMVACGCGGGGVVACGCGGGGVVDGGCGCGCVLEVRSGRHNTYNTYKC